VQLQNRDRILRRCINDERIMQMIEENLQNSVRRTLGIMNHMHHILKENGLHPFHFQRVQ